MLHYTLPSFGCLKLAHLVFRLEWNGLHLVHGIRLDAKHLIEPLQNDEERLWLTHVLDTRHEAGLLDCAVLKREVVVVNRENFILSTVDQQQSRAYRLVQCAIL